MPRAGDEWTDALECLLDLDRALYTIEQQLGATVAVANAVDAAASESGGTMEDDDSADGGDDDRVTTDEQAATDPRGI